MTQTQHVQSHIRRLVNEILTNYPRNQEEMNASAERIGNELLAILEPLAPSQEQIRSEAALTSESLFPVN